MHQHGLEQLIKKFDSLLQLLLSQWRVTVIRYRQMPHYKPCVAIVLQQAAWAVGVEPKLRVI